MYIFRKRVKEIMYEYIMEDYLIYFSNRLINCSNAIEDTELALLIQKDLDMYVNKELDEKTFKLHLSQALRCLELRVDSLKLILDM